MYVKGSNRARGRMENIMCAGQDDEEKEDGRDHENDSS